MALTALQRRICQLLASNRRELGESHVAGGVAPSVLTNSSRFSFDIDVFNDTKEALNASWVADRSLLEDVGLRVELVRAHPTFIEARVFDDVTFANLQWAQDSAYRFFPLVEHSELGLVLHPFDLATNKTLALIGRVLPRDWFDIITCNDRVQPLGYLAFASCGKDPGFSPLFILEEARRTARYSHEELERVEFEGERPDVVALRQRWHSMLGEANAVVRLLPAGEAGKCVLSAAGELYTGTAEELPEAVAEGRLRFHSGSIRGAYPTLVESVD